MGEEHGYQRSGKKCREKFENLYKYYKKTKEGKAGRQDGKHYRFFRQLEALYGETGNTPAAADNHQAGHVAFYCNAVGGSNNNNASKLSDSLSLSENSSDFESTSSGDSGEKGKKRKGRRSWKCKIKDFIDRKMRRLMEKQEAWLEKMMNTIEEKERERVLREEEWRKQEVCRMEREQKFWANERSWIEARDAALMEALHKISGKEMQHVGCSDDVVWEEIGSKMSCGGYDGNNAAICRDKWININNYILKCNNKRRKENSGNCFFPHHNNFQNNNGGSYSAEQPSGFRFLMGDNGENLWENNNYGLKPSKGGDN